MKGIPVTEAKNYVCPRSMGLAVRDKCIGNQCMAWRKSGEMSKTYRGDWTDRDTDGLGWTEFGYCGLAGPIEKE